MRPDTQSTANRLAEMLGISRAMEYCDDQIECYKNRGNYDTMRWWKQVKEKV